MGPLRGPGVQMVLKGRFLGLTGLTAGGFLSLTGPLAPCDCPTACEGKVVRSTKGGKGS